MVVYQEFIRAYEDIIPPAELDDPIVDGVDIKLLEKFKTTLEYQYEIAKRLKMAIKKINIDEIDFTVSGINNIIETININFYSIEQRLNDIAANSGVVDYDTSKQYMLYFGNHDRTVQMEVNNDAIIIESDSNKYEYSVQDDIVRQV